MASKTKKLSSSNEESKFKNEFSKNINSDFEKENNFKDFGFKESILKSLDKKGYINPTPIQKAAIPELMQGKDLLGQAQTGTGKTAAFAYQLLIN